MDPKGPRLDRIQIFHIPNNFYQCVPYCDMTAEIGAELKCDLRMEGQTDVKSEIVI